MKRLVISVLSLLLLVSLVACGNSAPKGEVTTAVTWEELVAANEPDAVLEKTGGYSVEITGESDEKYFFKSAIKDGKLVYTLGSEDSSSDDLYDGIVYTSYEMDGENRIEILPPSSTYSIPEDYNFSTYFAEFSDVDTVYVNDDAYFAKLYREDEEWAYTVEEYVFFDKETLLLTRIESSQKLGSLKIEYVYDITYGATDFELPSYNGVVNAEDTVELNIHYPDGTVTTTKVARNTEIQMGHSEDTDWSVCWDEECTGSIYNLRWVEGDKADLYICEGYVEKAPPLLRVVLNNSTFETIYKDNYDSYFQNIEKLDIEENLLQMVDLSWFVDEETDEPSLSFEIKDEEYEVVTCGRTRNNAWYFWSAESGYAVDFFDELSYVEGLVDNHRFYFDFDSFTSIEYEEESGCYYIPGASSLNESKYYINPDYEYIDRVVITHKDATEAITGYTHCYVGGNGYPLMGVDVIAEISEPSDADTIKLTVVSAGGEKTYSIRKDAKISYKGEALYSDEACTVAVTDLSWVDGKTATVYVK